MRPKHLQSSWMVLFSADGAIIAEESGKNEALSSGGVVLFSDSGKNDLGVFIFSWREE